MMKSLQKLSPHKRKIITVVSVALTLIVILIATPYIMQSKITKLLLEFGAQEASIADINLNPFSGEIEITDLRFSTARAGNQQLSKLSINVHLLSIFKKWIHLKSIDISGLNLSIEIDESGQPIIGGLALPLSEPTDKKAVKESKPWGFGIDAIALSQINIDYQDTKLKSQLNIEALHIGELANWNGEQESPFSLKAKLNDNVIEFVGKALPFAKDPTFSGKVMLQQIELKPFAVLVPQLTSLTGQVSLDSAINLVKRADSAIELTHTGEFKLENLKVQNPDIAIAQEQLTWNGTVALTINENKILTSMDALLTLKGVKATTGDTTLAALSALSSSIKFASLENVTLLDNSIEQLVVGNNLYKATSEKEQDKNLLSIVKISIPTISLSKMSRLEVDNVAVTGVTSMIRRNKAGTWLPLTLVEALPQPTATTKNSEKEEPATTTFKIGKFILSGENHILFDDLGVSPPYRANLSIKTLEVGTIDSAQADIASPLHLLAAIDKHSEISVTGTIKPFAAKPTMALSNTIKALPLSTLSSYSVPLMGYSLTSGQLDSKAEVKMGKGKIDGELRLTLNALEVESVVREKPRTEDSKEGDAQANQPAQSGQSGQSDQAKSPKDLDSQLNIPLGTALNMLRDKNRTIKLTIPISGDSDNPDIDPSDVINTAIAKAMKEGAMSYLIASLQPYGALISLVKMAGDAAMKVRLEPIQFVPTSARVSNKTKEYLPKVVKLMTDRPELNIKVCGVAVESDHQSLLAEAMAAAKREALKKRIAKGESKDKPTAKPVVPTISDEQLLELARTRVVAVKDLLITELKADATHLIDCQPTINRATEDNPPRVELLI